MHPRTWILSTVEDLQRLASFLPKLEGDLPLDVVVRPFVRQRSLPQNARLWALHAKASEITGYTVEEMHELALCHHYGFEEREVLDPISRRKVTKRAPLQRSSARTTKEFGAFMESCERWYADELGVWLE